jgi:hypothetical protein
LPVFAFKNQKDVGSEYGKRNQYPGRGGSEGDSPDIFITVEMGGQAERTVHISFQSSEKFAALPAVHSVF